MDSSKPAKRPTTAAKAAKPVKKQPVKKVAKRPAGSRQRGAS